ncbi:MAG: hypothetical protein AAF389_14900 [Gemmatimonadota bacterium]
MPVADFRVRIANAGATQVDGNVAVTLGLDDLAEVPNVSGPILDDILRGSVTSSPFAVRVISDAVLFTSSGRFTGLGRLMDFQRNLDGAGWTTRATGRIRNASEPDGRGMIELECSDEHSTARRSQLWRNTTSNQLHPPGLTAAFMDKPAAGTSSYAVREVDGDAVRIEPEIEVEVGEMLFVPQSIRDVLVTDLVAREDQAISATHSAGNFTALRFEYDSLDRTVISFSQALQGVILGTPGVFGLLREMSPESSGFMRNAWVYIPGHSLSVNDTITGRFYFPTGIPTSENVPYLIGGVDGIHPMELLEELLDGTHGGDVVGYETAALTTLKALPFRPVWVDEREPTDRAEWMRGIFELYGVAPLVGTDLQLRPTEIRLDQNVAPGALTTLSAANARDLDWNHGSAELVNVLALKGRALRAIGDEAERDVGFPPHGYDRVAVPYPEIAHDNVADLGEIVHELETSLILDPWFRRGTSPRPRELSQGLFEVFGDGAVIGAITVADDAGVNAGDQVVLDLDSLKTFNPETDDRTGDRIIRLLDFQDLDPANRRFRFIDLGPSAAVLAAPTVAIAQDGTDGDLLNVTISGLPAGATAHVECDVGTSTPVTYRYAKEGVGNEVVSFRIPNGSGTGYARAYATAPNRIRSDWATDTVALSARAKILEANVVKVADTAVVTWSVPSGTLGIRARYDTHERTEDPTFANQADYDASTGTLTITGVGELDVVSVELTPYTGWTGAAVSGSAGDLVIVKAVFPRITGGRQIVRPSIRVLDVEPRPLTPSGGDQRYERDAILVPNGACRSVRIEYSFVRPNTAANQPPPSTTFDVDYRVDLTSGRQVAHTLEDGASSPFIFLIQDDAGTPIKDSTFFITLTPNSRADGSGEDGDAETYEVRQLGETHKGNRVETNGGEEFEVRALLAGSGITISEDGTLSASGGGGGLTTYPAVFRESASTNITNAAGTVALDTETLDPDNGHSIASNEITVDNAGYYRISYSVPVNDDGSSGATRSRIFAWVERDTGGGYSVIAQSRGQDYAREASGGEGVNASFVCELTAGDTIRLRIQASSTTDVSTESGQAQMSLNRLRAA